MGAWQGRHTVPPGTALAASPSAKGALGDLTLTPGWAAPGAPSRMEEGASLRSRNPQLASNVAKGQEAASDFVGTETLGFFPGAATMSLDGRRGCYTQWVPFGPGGALGGARPDANCSPEIKGRAQ